ncbi:hypothetical protein BGZ99_004917 [Dissophora globulifera]|uniref:Uncharacterized protein n=1 Tax=Dissophora globulifera TaxID=979702 RepID=A0A9P6RXD1_9FUNG|nr:hypothetical protein BGZ99_004917 [Dissophora globulifera]
MTFDRDNPVMFSAIKFSTLDDNIPTVSTSSSPTSSPQHATRPIITHVSPSNNWASGDISNGSGFGKTSGALLPDNRDPEVKVAELMELKQMKIRQGDFLHLKDEIFQVSQALEEKQSILDEISSERKALQSELHRYIAMVRQVQKDFELAQRAEAELLKDRDQLSLHLTQLKNHDFKILKDEVDQLRTAKGLRPLPSLEQEEAEVMGRYLEQRRGQWREEGTPTLVSSLLNGGSSGGEFHRDRAGRPSTAASSSSSSSAAAIASAGASSRSSNRAQPSSSSTHASAPLASTSTSVSTSRSGRTTQQNHSKERQSYSHNRGSGSSSNVSAGKVRNHGSTSTADPSSSSTTRTGSARLGRPSKSSSSRSQSPSPAALPSSSSSLRGERSKKRQRY